MPALTNPRHERFAQALAQGKSATEALLAIGIDPLSQGEPKDYYVYVLIDPRLDQVFYVGKGKGKRLHIHYREWLADRGRNEHKLERITEICVSGATPVAVWLVDELSERDAYRAERHVMFRIGLENLSNRVGAPLPEIDKAAATARAQLKMMRPYCRMFNLFPPIHNEPGWEHMYWDVIAGYMHLIKLSENSELRIPSSAHFEAWKAEVKAAGRHV